MKTLGTCIIQRLVINSLYVMFALTGCVVIDATASHEQEPLPAGVNECWNPATTELRIVQGKCPTNPKEWSRK